VVVTADGRIFVWGGEERQTRPRQVHALAHMHAGPHQGLAPPLALAFVISTHHRLGSGTAKGRRQSQVGIMSTDLLLRLCGMAGGFKGPAGKNEGIKRLVGAT